MNIPSVVIKQSEMSKWPRWRKIQNLWCFPSGILTPDTCPSSCLVVGAGSSHSTGNILRCLRIWKDPLSSHRFSWGPLSSAKARVSLWEGIHEEGLMLPGDPWFPLVSVYMDLMTLSVLGSFSLVSVLKHGYKWSSLFVFLRGQDVPSPIQKNLTVPRHDC